MRACVLDKPAPVLERPLELRDVPDPAPSSGQVLIRVSACGICRTDLHVVEALLARLDQDDEVKRDGRSAVLRRAAELYLRQRKARDVAVAYRRAYGGQRGLESEFEGWEDEGAWPAQ